LSFIMCAAKPAIASRVSAGTSRTVRSSPLMRKIGGQAGLQVDVGGAELARGVQHPVEDLAHRVRRA
jgi:hypothetical protein